MILNSIILLACHYLNCLLLFFNKLGLKMLNSVCLYFYCCALDLTFIRAAESRGKGMAPAAPELSFFTSIHFNLFRQNIKPIKLKKNIKTIITLNTAE